MIIISLNSEQEVPEIRATTTEPDPDWSYKRSDGLAVEWMEDGDHWHIPHLVKKSSLAEPQYVDGEQYNEGEIKEYYIDPTNGEEVEPGYVNKQITRRIAGFTHYECEVLLTGHEKNWLTPKVDPLVLEKRTVIAEHDGKRIQLLGVWLRSYKEFDLDSGLFRGSLGLDNVVPVT